MIDDRYYAKIVRQVDEMLHRFELRRRHVWIAAPCFAIVLVGLLSFAAAQVVHARSQVSTLQSQSAAQQATIEQIDRQTQAIRQQLQRVQKQNQEIRALIGAPLPARSARMRALQKTSWTPAPSLPAVAKQVRTLSEVSTVTSYDSNTIRRFAMHVLNVRHLRDLVRAQMIAAIPSIDPVNGAGVVGCFCYRTSPDTEFHPGVDLSADYGETVRSAAAGTVVANGYDGGFGIKIDVDHGNGLHTWYAHLSRADVEVGAHVFKGEAIGAVGSTGFSTGPHLHYQLMRDGVPIDPTPYLHGVPSNVLASLP
ncbi:MAG: peptidoglycan DD-metalloendopeptidase family protein [Candidatus Eremiobacteraeota bacterium]|nr:peptidoglycan DD-metalloendopeptidase family protein [Candidatus Eremiobacteraeota bacterium]